MPDFREELVRIPRGKGKLQEAPTREAIEASKSEASPSAAVDSETPANLVGPLTEQEFTGGTYYSETSSDGLFVIEFATYTDYLDANLTTLRFNHRDPAL